NLMQFIIRSGEFSDILRYCLVKDPDQRPTAADVLRHPFLAKAKNNAGVRALISEAKAEVVEVEEQVIPDDVNPIDTTAVDGVVQPTESIVANGLAIAEEPDQPVIATATYAVVLKKSDREHHKKPAPPRPTAEAKTPTETKVFPAENIYEEVVERKSPTENTVLPLNVEPPPADLVEEIVRTSPDETVTPVNVSPVNENQSSLSDVVATSSSVEHVPSPPLPSSETMETHTFVRDDAPAQDIVSVQCVSVASDGVADELPVTRAESAASDTLQQVVEAVVPQEEHVTQVVIAYDRDNTPAAIVVTGHRPAEEMNGWLHPEDEPELVELSRPGELLTEQMARHNEHTGDHPDELIRNMDSVEPPVITPDDVEVAFTKTESAGTSPVVFKRPISPAEPAGVIRGESGDAAVEQQQQSPPLTRADQCVEHVDVVVMDKSSASSPIVNGAFVQPTLRAGVIRRENRPSPSSSNASSERGHSLNISDRETVSVVSSSPVPFDDGQSSQDNINYVDPSETSSVATEDSFSDKENKARKVVNEPAVVMRRKRQGEASAENQRQRRTLKKTRKFVIDGVVVTTTSTKVIDPNEENRHKEDLQLRKEELRELKLLQKQEMKAFQDLATKAQNTKEQQERRFEADIQVLIRNYENDLDQLLKQQKQRLEREEQLQDADLRAATKKLSADHEKELKAFREALKQEQKLLKHECEVNIAKAERKEVYKARKEKLDQEQTAKEEHFISSLNDAMTHMIGRMKEQYHEKIAMMEKQFLQQKQQLIRSREADIWEREERHYMERHQLAKRQMKDIFFLQRCQMLLRFEKERDQIKRINEMREQELVKQLTAEKKLLPKRIRNEMKTRELMYRESLRITHISADQEKEKVRWFQEQEKKRYKAEQVRQEQKHSNRVEELRAAAEANLRELEQIQNEKRKVLMDTENVKLRALEVDHSESLQRWKNDLILRKQKLEEDFVKQAEERERFYSTTFLRNGDGDYGNSPTESSTDVDSAEISSSYSRSSRT
ncbi:serine/threonine-protein kinase 10-like, partial [Paramacrobiotus metropolitanus]|uniref:serine/threonine-protein kinase 10-like n=1 Tax=Paramacrobiotus metropolitanus TaxID=2943436 RepID=UPI002445D458